MSDSRTRLRLRSLVTDYRWVIALACVLALVSGGWIAYGAHVDPGEETEQRLVHSWSTTGDLSHSAVVEEENAVYPVGSRLSNQPLYYTRLSPTVEGTYSAGYESQTGDDVTIDLEVELVWQSTDDEHTYWRETESLAAVTDGDVEPGEDVEATFSVNVSAVEERMDEIESDLGASPGDREVFIRVDRSLEGVVDGDHRTETDTHEIEIAIDGSTHSLETPDGLDRSHDEYETVTVTQSHGPERTAGGPLLALLGLIGLGALAAIPTSRYEPTPEERDWLAYQEALEEHGSLVTPTRLPAEVEDRPEAEIDRFETLIQLGIDLEAAILDDRESGQYVVLTDELRYVYEPPTRPASVSREEESEELERSDADEPDDGRAAKSGTSEERDALVAFDTADEGGSTAGADAGKDETGEDINTDPTDVRSSEEIPGSTSER
ncbi:DUF5305 domain-containing protein [Natrialbaceae archaeon A-CW3]